MPMTDHPLQLALFPFETPRRHGAAVEAALEDLAERADARRLAAAALTPTELNVLLLRHGGVPPRSLAATAEAIGATGREQVRRVHRSAARKLLATSDLPDAA